MPRLPYSHCVWRAISCFAFLIEESLTFFSSKEQGKVAAIGGVQNTCGCSWISTKLPTLPHYALLFIFLMGLFLKKWPLSTFIGDFLPQNILFFFIFPLKLTAKSSCSSWTYLTHRDWSNTGVFTWFFFRTSRIGPSEAACFLSLWASSITSPCQSIRQINDGRVIQK